MTYGRLAVILSHLPLDSAYARSIGGQASQWSLTDHLLALIADLLAAANWQRGGGKGKRPKPLQRPGINDTDSTKIGGRRVMSLEQARVWRDKRRAKWL